MNKSTVRIRYASLSLHEWDVRCCVWQCVAVCCGVLRCVAVCCGVMQCVAVSCRSETVCVVCVCGRERDCHTLRRTATHDKTWQFMATHGNPQQLTATQWTQCNILKQTATHWNKLQHTATHYNALQRREFWYTQQDAMHSRLRTNSKKSTLQSFCIANLVWGGYT